jgi:hypothetical protein
LVLFSNTARRIATAESHDFGPALGAGPAPAEEGAAASPPSEGHGAANADETEIPEKGDQQKMTRAAVQAVMRDAALTPSKRAEASQDISKGELGGVGAVHNAGLTTASLSRDSCPGDASSLSGSHETTVQDGVIGGGVVGDRVVRLVRDGQHQGGSSASASAGD